jgi:hypothetical protein
MALILGPAIRRGAFSLGVALYCMLAAGPQVGWTVVSSQAGPRSPCRGCLVGRCLAQQLRQLDDVGGDAPGLISRQQLCRSLARFILELDICERLADTIPHDETGVRFLDGPRRREAAARSQLTTP